MVTVGIDPHKHVHVAVVVDADGRRLTRPLTVQNDANLIVVLLKWIRTIAEGTPVTWAIEDGRGFARRLADGLLLTGHEVVWVPTRLVAAHRKLHAATGSKSDPVDAAAVAHAAIATPGLGRHRIDDRVRELRVLVDSRADLVRRRTMVINQTKAYTHLWLDHTPGDLTRRPGMASLTTLVDTTVMSGHVRRVLTEMITEIDGLNKRVRGLETTIRELVTPLVPALPGDHRDQPCLRGGSSLPRSVTSPVSPAQRSSPATPGPHRSRSTPPTKSATDCSEAATGGSTACSTRRRRPAAISPRCASTPGPPRAGQGSPRGPAHAPSDRCHPPRHDQRPSLLAAPHHPTPAHRLT